MSPLKSSLDILQIWALLKILLLSFEIFKDLSIFLLLSFFITCYFSPSPRLSRIFFYFLFSFIFLTVLSHHHCPGYHIFLFFFFVVLFFQMFFFYH